MLASNTSSLSIAKIGAKTPHPGRVVGMHFFNPVHKMPLVEVIAPEGADASAVNTVFAFTRKLGKTPVLVKDTPGFLVNRLLMFYSTEAMWLLHEGHRIEDCGHRNCDGGECRQAGAEPRRTLHTWECDAHGGDGSAG